MLNILQIILGYLKVKTELTPVEIPYKYDDHDLEQFLEGLSPFYYEKPIEDIRLMELCSRVREKRDC
jgi:hypothetical protein|tara:strand:- start:56 stop:256 length:201 start_codon:yes stop_codon:yes gene_type:complete